MALKTYPGRVLVCVCGGGGGVLTLTEPLYILWYLPRRVESCMSPSL